LEKVVLTQLLSYLNSTDSWLRW